MTQALGSLPDSTSTPSMNLLQHTKALQPQASDWPGVSLATSHDEHAQQRVFILDNTVDPTILKDQLNDVDRIELHFPKFTDGRAYSQAVMLRRRCGFKGDIRATGDVLVDQIVQMKRTGFTSAVLRDDQNAQHAQKLLTQFVGFYQGDALESPLFARH
jgi:uncharacterized protein (DUF934 family)